MSTREAASTSIYPHILLDSGQLLSLVSDGKFHCHHPEGQLCQRTCIPASSSICDFSCEYSKPCSSFVVDSVIFIFSFESQFLAHVPSSDRNGRNARKGPRAWRPLLSIKLPPASLIGSDISHMIRQPHDYNLEGSINLSDIPPPCQDSGYKLSGWMPSFSVEDYVASKVN